MLLVINLNLWWTSIFSLTIDVVDVVGVNCECLGRNTGHFFELVLVLEIPSQNKLGPFERDLWFLAMLVIRGPGNLGYLVMLYFQGKRKMCMAL